MNNKHFVRSLLEGIEDPILFEIGAGDFADTAEFVKTFKDLDFNLFVFEPDPRNLELFDNRIKDSRVHLFEGVIGNKTAIVDFYQSTENPYTGQQFIYSSSLRRPGKDLFKTWPVFIDEETSFRKVRIQSVTLDDFVKNIKIPRIDYIFADIQGCEDLLIEGGINTLNNITRYLYTEYNNNEIYIGEPNLEKILSMLPNFEIMYDFITDVLLKNRNL